MPPAPGAPSILTPTLPSGTVGSAYEGKLNAEGGLAPYRWTVAGGALPAGLGLDGVTGRITGSPSEVGTATFTMRVEGTDNRASVRTLAIAIGEAGAPLPPPLLRRPPSPPHSSPRARWV